MAGSFSDYLENNLCGRVFGGTGVNFTPSTVHYIALFKSAPTDTGGGTESTGSNYGRVTFQSSTSNWTTASSGYVFNAVAITWPQSSGSWGVITHFGIYDSSSTGGTNNLYAWADLTASKTIDDGDTVSFSSGALSINIT